MRILLMEDDPVLADIVTEHLQARYEVDHAFDANDANTCMQTHRYDLYIFDINVPGQNGLSLLRERRSFHDMTPTIIVTAYEDTAHLTAGFDAGAHDYIKKPFALEELDARIENTRRLFGIDTDETVDLGGGRQYDAQTRTVRTARGESHTLSPKEAALLDYFLAHPHRTVSTEELVQNLWDFDSLPSDATLRSHIRRLRELIGREKITTLRGIGYRYE